jgi:hypothetical protein
MGRLFDAVSSDLLRICPALNIAHRQGTDRPTQSVRGLDYGMHSLWKVLQAATQDVKFLLVGDPDATRLTHGDFQFGLALEQVQCFGDSLHGVSPLA